MVSANMVEKIKEIQTQAKAIDEACVTLLGNPNLSDVIQMANLLEGFLTSQPKLATAPKGEKRVRRTREQIEAERASKGAEGKA